MLSKQARVMNIDHIISKCRTDARCVSGDERRAMASEIERLRKALAAGRGPSVEIAVDRDMAFFASKADDEKGGAAMISQNTDEAGRMVLGFVFDAACSSVLLINKNRPHWQKGKYNGIGGHVRVGEIAPGAMQREFSEEAGISIPIDHWQYVGTLAGKSWRVEVFAARWKLQEAKTVTDETVNIFPTDKLPVDQMIGNLSWIVPLAIDKLTRNEPASVHVIY